MALKLIMGAAGSGKTTYAFDEVIRIAEKNRNRHVFVLVPDQFSQEATAMIMEQTGGGAADRNRSAIASGSASRAVPASVTPTAPLTRSQGITRSARGLRQRRSASSGRLSVKVQPYRPLVRRAGRIFYTAARKIFL